MSKHYCIVPGCKEAAPHMLTLRCRRPDVSAVWAPVTDAHLCDKHAEGGGTISLIVEPNSSGHLDLQSWAVAHGVDGEVVSRRVKITQRAKRINGTSVNRGSRGSRRQEN